MKKQYLGKTCPFCKTKFSEQDTVVFCTLCEMPHHLSCWKTNEGCTTFGCTGSMGDIIGPQSVQKRQRESSPIAGIPTVSRNAQRPQSASSPTVGIPTVTRSSQIIQNPVLSNIAVSNIGNVESTKSPITSKRQAKRECLYRVSEHYIQNESLITVEDVALLMDHSQGALFVRCTFRSISDIPIIMVSVDINLKDEGGNDLPGLKNYQFINLNVKRDMLFGQNQPIQLKELKARKVYVSVARIMLDNGEVIIPNKQIYSIDKQKSLTEYYGDNTLADSFISKTSTRSNYFPLFGDYIWQCSCGGMNLNDEENCHVCGVKKNTVFDASENRSPHIDQQKTAVDQYIPDYDEKDQLNEVSQTEKVDANITTQIELEDNNWMTEYAYANIFASDLETDYSSISKYCTFNVHFGIKSHSETEGVFTAVTYWPTGETTQAEYNGTSGNDLCVKGSWSSPSNAPEGDVVIALYDPSGKKITTKSFYYG